MKDQLFLMILIISISILRFENGIIHDLNQNTFEAFIKSNNYSFILFFSGSNPLENIYTELANEVKNLNLDVSIGKIEVIENSNILDQFVIKNFPDLKLFSNSMNWLNYNSGKSLKELIVFLKMQINKSIRKVNEIEQFSFIKNNNPIFVLICGVENDNSHYFHEYYEILKNYQEIQVFYTKNNEIASFLECDPYSHQLLLFRNDNKLKYENGNEVLNEPEFTEWLSFNLQSGLNEISNDILHYIITNQIKTVILVENRENQELESIFYEQFKVKHQHLYCLIAKEQNEVFSQIINFYNIKTNELPTIVGLSSQVNGIVSKYRFFHKVIDRNTIEEWMNNFINNNIERYFISEDLPNIDKKEGVKIIVGKTFDNEILNNDNDVLLFISAPWSTESKKIEEKIFVLARILKNNTNLTIAKLDGANNEVEGLDIEILPQILFFRGGQKGLNKLITKKNYEGMIIIKDIIEFILKSSFHLVKDIEILKPEELIESDEKEDFTLINNDEEDYDEIENYKSEL